MTTISDSAEVNDRVRIEARLTSLETVIETERPHLATKADINALETKMERQTKQIILWLIGHGIAIFLGLAALLSNWQG